MMKSCIYILFLVTFTSCSLFPKKEIAVPEWREVDLYADYPMKQLDISQFAEVVYLPLSKKFGLKDRFYYSDFMGSVSKDYIVSYTLDGDVEVFDNCGQKLHGFNAKGSDRNEEYIGIKTLLVDDGHQEVWILDFDNSFKIYSLSGIFKRKLGIPEPLNVEVVRHWRPDTLLCYDDNRVEDGLSKNPTPFYLLSKKTGEVRMLEEVRVSQRLNNEERLVLNVDGRNHVLRFVLSTLPLAVCEDKMVLADYATDTVFCYQQGKVYPLFVRKPSVYASLPFKLTSVDFMTSRYLFFSIVEKTSTKERFQRDFLYDFETQEIIRYELRNKDFYPPLITNVNNFVGNYSSDWLVKEMSADKFLQYYREGKLHGKASEVAKEMKGEYTSVLILYKFHK